MSSPVWTLEPNIRERKHTNSLQPLSEDRNRGPASYLLYKDNSIVPQKLVNDVVREICQTWQAGTIYPVCAMQLHHFKLHLPLHIDYLRKKNFMILTLAMKNSFFTSHTCYQLTLIKRGKDPPFVRNTYSIHKIKLESFPWKQGNNIPALHFFSILYWKS